MGRRKKEVVDKPEIIVTKKPKISILKEPEYTIVKTEELNGFTLTEIQEPRAHHIDISIGNHWISMTGNWEGAYEFIKHEGDKPQYKKLIKQKEKSKDKELKLFEE